LFTWVTKAGVGYFCSRFFFLRQQHIAIDSRSVAPSRPQDEQNAK
jgi:hypothetical protein